MIITNKEKNNDFEKFFNEIQAIHAIAKGGIIRNTTVCKNLPILKSSNLFITITLDIEPNNSQMTKTINAL